MKGCKCGRHHTDQWHRWVVLDRAKSRKQTSKLYCLDCRGEWKSRAKYVVLLPDHTKRTRSGLTDRDILDLIRGRQLCIDVEFATVTNAAGQALQVVEREHPKGPQKGKYRFVSICAHGKKKKVALHRLVWMAAHLKLIPDGYDIDHIGSQDDDSIGNLRLLESGENRSLGAKKANQADAPF